MGKKTRGHEDTSEPAPAVAGRGVVHARPEGLRGRVDGVRVIRGDWGRSSRTRGRRVMPLARSPTARRPLLLLCPPPARPAGGPGHAANAAPRGRLAGWPGDSEPAPSLHHFTFPGDNSGRQGRWGMLDPNVLSASGGSV